MKKLWFVINALLLALSVIGWFTGADNLYGVSITLIIVLSFPLNLLVGWLFFAYGSSLELMLLMAFVMSAVGYVQWFELVPRIAKFLSRKLAKHDRQIEVLVTREADPKQIEFGNNEESRPWPPYWYDNEKYSPVERVFDQDVSNEPEPQKRIKI